MKNFRNGIYKLKTCRSNDHYEIKHGENYVYIQLQGHTIRITCNHFYFLDKQKLYEKIFSNYSYNLGIQDIYELILKPLKQLYEIHLLHEQEAKKQGDKNTFCNMNFSLE